MVEKIIEEINDTSISEFYEQVNNDFDDEKFLLFGRRIVGIKSLVKDTKTSKKN